MLIDDYSIEQFVKNKKDVIKNLIINAISKKYKLPS